ncbi:class D sortase [Lederbergia wuyishanensis]|uniref:Sortase A n=1 Tax=Lederbergia wuyishanensis TaxID=1347903 RepID=A0ABU0D6W0_9BACI|nr:sortase [Lederbergia wuyishanensis]MCJ8008827.1 sortase [Lederbergia wuyishanensis]MDQ0344149.1 sortase A [Lederbergia wuyishanensis]
MKNAKLIVGLVFLTAGLTFISIPLYYEWQQGKELRALEEALFLISEGNSESVDLSSIDNLSFTEDQLKDVMELEIPSINLKQKILGETTEENLRVALTQLKKDQTPGVGNFTIAGHRGYRGERHFSRLPQVSIGDKVFLHTDKQTFVYKVTNTEVIDPSYVEILDDHQEKKEITMITCTKSGLDRIVVIAELIETTE